MNSIQYQQFKILILNILPLNENSKQTIVVQREIDLLHNIFEVFILFILFYFLFFLYLEIEKN